MKPILSLSDMIFDVVVKWRMVDVVVVEIFLASMRDLFVL